MESRLAAIVREHQADVKRYYYIHRTFRIEEYEEMIARLSDAITHADEQNKELLENEKLGLTSDLNRQLEWLKFYAQRVEELTPIDSYEEMIAVVKDCIANESIALSDNLIGCMWEQFVAPFTFVGRSCEKTMKSVFNDKISKSSLEDIRRFFDQLKNNLIRYLLTDKECTDYNLREKQLKRHFNSSVNLAYEHLFKFIGKKVLDVDYDEVHNSDEAMALAKECTSQLNQMFADTLDDELKDAMDVVLSIEKDYFGVNDSNVCEGFHPASQDFVPLTRPSACQSTRKSTEPKSTDLFIESLPDGLIEVNQLVNMWNSYFEATENIHSLCQRKDFTQHFDISRSKVKGVRHTYYQKHLLGSPWAASPWGSPGVADP